MAEPKNFTDGNLYPIVEEGFYRSDRQTADKPSPDSPLVYIYQNPSGIWQVDKFNKKSHVKLTGNYANSLHRLNIQELVNHLNESGNILEKLAERGRFDRVMKKVPNQHVYKILLYLINH